MKKTRIISAALAFAAVILCSASCQGKPSVIFDREKAELFEAAPEFSLSVSLTDRDGKTLKPSSVLKLADGKMTYQAAFSYDGILPRKIGLLCFINGIPQKVTLDGGEEAYYHKLDMPDGRTRGLSCTPSGVGGDGRAEVKFVVFTDAEPGIYYSNDNGEYAEAVLEFKVDLSKLPSPDDPVGTGGEKVSLEKIALDALPSEEQIAQERAQGSDIDFEELKASALAIAEELGNVETPSGVVNNIETMGILRQRTVVSVDATDSETKQLYFEAVGKAGEKYRTTLFIAEAPCRTFGKNGVIEWSPEKGELLRYAFSPPMYEDYRESEMFAVTLSEKGEDVFVTPRLVLVNTSRLIDTAQVTKGMKSYITSAEGERVAGIQEYTGGDLEYTVTLECEYPLAQDIYSFIMIDGAPVESVIGAEKGVMHELTLTENKPLTFSVFIPGENLKTERFTMTVGVLNRYSPKYYDQYFRNSYLGHPSRKLRFSSDGEWEDGLTDDDLDSLSYGAVNAWPGDADGTLPTGSYDVFAGEDQVFTYCGRCNDAGILHRAFVIFNGEVVEFENGKTVFEWSGEKGETIETSVKIPKEKLKTANEMRIFVTELYKGDVLSTSTVLATVRAHGKIEGKPVGVYSGEEGVLVDSDGDTLSAWVLSSRPEIGFKLISNTTTLRSSIRLGGSFSEALIPGELYEVNLLRIEEKNGVTTVTGYRIQNTKNIPW